MCLILFANQVHPKYPLIVVANRDEFYPRPTAAAHWWNDNLLAGRDLKSGGSWMGVTKTGRFAALTNFRDGFDTNPNAITRGQLIKDFLEGSMNGMEYLRQVQPTGKRYNGFNLLAGDTKKLYYYSNFGGTSTIVQPGIHGLSNSFMDVPWPKVERGKAGLRQLVEQNTFDIEAAFQLMQNRTIAPDADLPKTKIPIEWERRLSAMYIKHENYGTRCTTVILMDAFGNVTFEERSYVPEHRRKYQFFTRKGNHLEKSLV